MKVSIMYAIAAMIGYGVNAIIYKVASKSIDALSLALMTTAFMSITIFVFWIFAKNHSITPEGFKYSLLAGAIGGVSIIAFVYSIYLGEVSIASTLRGLSFVVTTIIAILFLSEQLTLMNGVGIIFAAIAVILLTQ